MEDLGISDPLSVQYERWMNDITTSSLVSVLISWLLSLPVGISSAALPNIFFFSSRRRHTRLQGDWRSDVCSSDLSPLLDRMTVQRGKRRGQAVAKLSDE